MKTMKNRYRPLIAILVFLGVILTNVIARAASRHPELVHYVVRVSPAIPHDDLQKARIALEESIFQSVNALTVQESNLTTSEALDRLLPIRERAANVQGGVEIVLRNYGRATAHNIQATLTLGLPIEQYRIFPSETVSTITEDKANGKLQLHVEKLAASDKIQISVLFSGKYDIFLAASRTEDTKPPVLTPSKIDSMQEVQILATQTAVAIYNQSNLEGLLQFTVENAIDAIPFSVDISSDEGPSHFYETSMGTEDNNLFFESFKP